MRRFAALIPLFIALGCHRDVAQIDAQYDERYAEVIAVDRIVPPSGDGYDLNRVTFVRTLSDQRIAVLNAGSNEVLLLSPNGGLEQRIGRAGEGPGEFTSPVFMSALANDSIVVTGFDRRGVVFSSSGSVARTFTLERRPGGIAYASPMGITATGDVIGAEGQDFGLTPGMNYLPMQFVAYDLTGSLLHSFELDGIGNEAFLVAQGEAVRVASPPFRIRGFAAAGPDGLALASSNSSDVRTVNSEGVVQRTVRLPRDASPPERRLVDSVRAAWAEASATEDGRVLRRRAILEMPLPTARPVIGDLRVDRSGGVWVADAGVDGTPGTRWDVYAEESHLGFVDLPKGINIKEIGADHILAVETDSLGVESVLRISLRVLDSQ